MTDILDFIESACNSILYLKKHANHNCVHSQPNQSSTFTISFINSNCDPILIEHCLTFYFVYSQRCHTHTINFLSNIFYFYFSLFTITELWTEWCSQFLKSLQKNTQLNKKKIPTNCIIHRKQNETNKKLLSTTHRKHTF